MASIVLVPGAWLGGWVWDRVSSELRSCGHEVHPATLPGLGDRVDELTPAVGLMSHVVDLADLCKRLDLRDAILVGHSYAGAVVGGVARRLPDRFHAQAYLDTMPLPEGLSLLEGFSPTGRARFSNAIIEWRGTRVWPMPEPLGSQAPVDGLSPEDLNLLRARGTPYPAFTFEQPLSGPLDVRPPPKNHAISCVEDDTAAATERVDFLNQHPDWTYHALPICHWPMLSSPVELASILNEIARS